MSFKPKIDFCLKKDNDDNYYLELSDITDNYNVSFNPNGWDHASTIFSSSVTSLLVTLTITDSANVESSFTYDSILDIEVPIDGPFELTPINNETSNISFVDGFYKIEYTVVSGGVSYKTCHQKILYPTVGCCISNSIKKLMEDLEDKKQQDFVNKIKSYEQALKEAAKSVDSTSALKILNLLEDYCNSSQAGCGCGCD